MYQEPTIAGILRHLASEYDGPVEERRVLDQVLERRPSSAKNPYATIRERLRWDGLALGWLRLDRRRLMPLRVAMQGLRFRCVPRACDVAAGLLPLAHLQPFAGLRGATLSLSDEHGAPLPLIDPDDSDDEPAEIATPSFDLSAWYRRHGFVAGDSILVTVDGAEAMELTIEREPAADLRREAVAAQDSELIEAIVTRVGRSQLVLIPCDEVVLPIFATAPWRTAYPGSPWQHLVTRDTRLQLVDDIFLTNQRHPSLRLFSSDEVFEPAPESEPDRIASETALLAEIDALQREMREARDRDADAGIWSGQIQRASAAHNTLDRFADNLRGAQSASIDPFPHDREPAGWGDAPWDVSDLFEPDELISDDPAAIADAQSRMLAALPPEAVERLKHARPEEAEVIIAQHLNMLLVRAPALFPKIELDLSATADQSADPSLQALQEEPWPESWDDDDEWVAELDDEIDLGDETGSFARSGDLIARFHDYLAEIGKSAATARARARALRIYAEFLAAYYERTLAEGDYATLDECLFYYYPRRVMNTSPRQVRDLCTAIKQFYSFLVARGEITDDRFAQAIWRRRDQAAHLLELYDRLSGDSPDFDRLFARLFWPYTT